MLTLLMAWLLAGEAEILGSPSVVAAEGKAAVSFDSRFSGRTDPKIVSAIRTLGPRRANAVFVSMAAWSESDPELTGTLGQAWSALSYLLASPDFGPESVFAVVDRLHPSAAQAFLVGLAGTARSEQPSAAQRCQDALRALQAPLEEGYIDVLVAAGLPASLPSLTELHGLRLLSIAELPPQKQEAVRWARLSVPAPNPAEPIQKIIKLKDLARFLNGEFSPTVGGSVAVYDQVDFLRTPAELIAGLRLDYPGGFAGETRVGALVFPRPDSFRLRVPFDPLLGGTPAPELVYPFTGTGFTADVRERLVPELSLRSTVREPLPVGTQAFEIDEAGERHLRATLGASRQWVIEGAPTAGKSRRTVLSQPALYCGFAVLLVSSDGDRFEVAAQGVRLPEGLLKEQTQIGPAEYLGWVHRSDPNLVLLAPR